MGAIMVTGASSGIGAAVAVELARRGFTVGCLSRRGTTPGAENLVPYRADVRDEEAVAAALAELAERAGALEGLVNAAGVLLDAAPEEMTAGQLRAVMEVNFVAAFTASRLAYPHLRETGGLVVSIGSFYDHLGPRRNLAYAASKAALGALTRCLAVEWARDGIRVLNVAPGYVLTDLNREFFENPDNRARIERRIPLRRLGEPGEVGCLVASLFSERVGFLTGETIYVDGGQGVAP